MGKEICYCCKKKLKDAVCLKDGSEMTVNEISDSSASNHPGEAGYACELHIFQKGIAAEAGDLIVKS